MEQHHYIVFSGHMIDKPDRGKPRFPPNKETVAANAIESAILKLRAHFPELKLTAIAGGACGGDILFHEKCISAGIDTLLFLALPDDEFISKSVRFAGEIWVNRFEKVKENAKEVFYLDKKLKLPEWMPENTRHTVWEMINMQMLQYALRAGGQNATLIALWDSETGDGAGGTEQMVDIAGKEGIEVVFLDAKQLFA